MWNYTNAVHEHFLRPHNAGPMEDANAIGEVGSLACGDALKLYLKINDEGIIEKASFETFGCASAIASSSVLTDMVKGMKAEDALKLTNKEIAETLHLSEGTVKQYINQLYAKLDIGGDVRTRRARLAELFRTKN